MADYIVTLASCRSRPGQYILERPVMADHVKIGGCKDPYLVAQVPGNGNSFQEDLRQDHGGSEIYGDPAFEPGNTVNKISEIEERSFAYRFAIRARVLVDDIRTDGDMRGHRHLELKTGCEDA